MVRHHRRHPAGDGWRRVRAAIEEERQALEAQDAPGAWTEHQDAAKRWAASAEAISQRSSGPFGSYWAWQRALDGV